MGALNSLLVMSSKYLNSEYRQGSKLGWSCGPSLPKLLSDHQIALGGGPVVYWKTHHYGTVFKKKFIGTDNLYAFIYFSVNVMYCNDCSNALYKKM